MNRPMPERWDRVGIQRSGPHKIVKYVFGYTCVNDIAAVELLKTDPSFGLGTLSNRYI